MSAPVTDPLVEQFRKHHKAFSGFLNNVTDFFSRDNEALLDGSGRFVVHTTKHRFKDPSHLREKIDRKLKRGIEVTNNNLFDQITDYCGVRVLHLRRVDFGVIHSAIKSHIEEQHWFLHEDPKAYTWDPEHKPYFENFGLKTEVKDSFYTSVHYLVKPNEESKVVCEIQVRSLFEEIWGEVDHDLNYPSPSSSTACREQLKVLAKLVGAGSRLVDSIYNSLDEHRPVTAPPVLVAADKPPESRQESAH